MDSTSEVRLGSKLTNNESKDGSKMILYESKEVKFDEKLVGDLDDGTPKELRGTDMSEQVSPRSAVHGQESENVYRYNTQYNK